MRKTELINEIVTGRIYLQSITDKFLYPYYTLFIFDGAFRLHTLTATNWTFQILTEAQAKEHCKNAPYTRPYLFFIQGSEVCPHWNWLKAYFPKVKSILPENADNLKKTLFSLNEEDIYKIFNDHSNN